MPTIHRQAGYRFFFYSNEGSPAEPVHIHVQKGGAEAKIWLQPEITISDSYGFNSAELRGILQIVVTNQLAFKEAWHEHFGN